MAEPWVTLLAGSSLVLIGFLAAQLFDRFRLPDYVVLLGIGVVLGSDLLPPGPWNPEALVLGVRPFLIAIAITFILFEGGLALHLRGIGHLWAYAALHTFGGIFLSVAGTWVVCVYLLGLSSTTSLILGLAMCAPSAAIVMSILPRLRVAEKTRFTLTLEGVLGNIVAAALVLTIVRFPGGLPGGSDLGSFALTAGIAVLVAVGAGLAWDRVVGAATPRRFMSMTSVALAVLLYAIGEGLLAGNGGLAAFTFGLVLGHWGPLQLRDEASAGSRRLREFHEELVFLLRTFFFIYLGLLIDFTHFTWQAFLGAVVLVAVFVLIRFPTVAVLARRWDLPKTDVRVMRAAIVRGLTDTVLVLFAISTLVIPPSEAGPVANLLFTLVFLTATVSAALVLVAERGAAPTSAAVDAGSAIANAQAPLPPPPLD